MRATILTHLYFTCALKSHQCTGTTLGQSLYKCPTKGILNPRAYQPTQHLENYGGLQDLVSFPLPKSGRESVTIIRSQIHMGLRPRRAPLHFPSSLLFPQTENMCSKARRELQPSQAFHLSGTWNGEES